MSNPLNNNFNIKTSKNEFRVNHEDSIGQLISVVNGYKLDKKVLTSHDNALTQTLNIYYKQEAQANGETDNLRTASGADKSLLVKVLFSGDAETKDSITGPYNKLPFIPDSD